MKVRLENKVLNMREKYMTVDMFAGSSKNTKKKKV